MYTSMHSKKMFTYRLQNKYKSISAA